ncbi:MAG TPA: hypothetical protein VME42_05050 [Steroidobacteraceae bacterium]|nr:hypothetical protein [Steroidobacteraceae bacterium]
MLKMKMRADLPKMPRLPQVPPSADACSSESAGAAGPPPSPSAFRYTPPPADYEAPSILSEHRGLALIFLAAACAFALYCWRAPHRPEASAAPSTAPSLRLGDTAGGAQSPRSAPLGRAASATPPIYVETLPESAQH